MTREDREDFLLKQMADAIQEYGWAVTGVFDADPPFVYTAGLTLQGKPELYMAGLDINVMATVVNAAAQSELALGDRTGEFITNGYKLAVAAVDPVAARMSVPLIMFGSDRVRALQLVWPDPKHRYPWDRKYNAKRFPQPLYPVDEGS